MSEPLKYITAPARVTIKGVAFPMRNEGTGGFVTQNTDIGSLRDGILQLLLTTRGSRVMRADFGTSINALAFEPLGLDTAETVKREILQAISKYEPRVVVNSLDVLPLYDAQKIKIFLSISAKNNLLTSEDIELFI